MIMKYKHILFDIDGTLVDNESAVISTWQQTINELFGKHYEKSELNFVLGIPGVPTMQKLGASDPDEAFKVWSINFQKHRNEICLFDGIADVMKELKKQGYHLGLITSRTRDELNNDDALCLIYDLFDCAICVTDTKSPKPSAEPLLAYIEQCGANRNECLYIGDAAYDSLCAQNANVDFCLATWSEGKKDIPCKYLLSKPKDIFDCLK